MLEPSFPTLFKVREGRDGRRKIVSWTQPLINQDVMIIMMVLIIEDDYNHTLLFLKDNNQLIKNIVQFWVMFGNFFSPQKL